MTSGYSADFLVIFKLRNDLAAFANLKEALERLLGRPVDLLEREALEEIGVSFAAGRS